MAMSYVPFNPDIPYLSPSRQPSHQVFFNASYPPTYSQRSLHPAHSIVPTPQHNSTWSQSCLFAPSFPSELYAALPVPPQRAVPLTCLPATGATTLSIETEFPPSPSDTSSSSEPGPSPSPEFIRAVCNAPLVAPVPLPYHSPTFLQFDLPDDDEDLSHPPYVFRPHKRKRSETELDDSELMAPNVAKRRFATMPAAPGRSNVTRHQRTETSARYPLRRWPIQPGVSYGNGMPG